MSIRKMKVLMVEHFLPGSPYSKELCRGLAKECSLTLLTNRTYKDDGMVNWKCRPVLNMPYCKNKAKSLYYIICGWIKIILELIFGNYDIVHVQSFKFFEIERRIYSIFKGKKYLIHTVHNMLPHEKNEKDFVRYKKFYSRCDMLIVHNQYCKNLLIKSYGIDEKKIVVIPHGAYWKPGCLAFPQEQNKVNFLQLGMIRKYKGVDILLDAIAKIPETEREKMHFTIAGNQSPRLDNTDYASMIKKLNIEDCVTFISRRIPDEKMDFYYNQANACIFPYREIYGSGALLMAYGYAKPVITSDIPAFIEETNNGMTGLLFKSEDSDDLAKKILQFTDLNQTSITKTRVYIRNLVEKKYNWSISAKSTAEVYRKIDEKDLLI